MYIWNRFPFVRFSMAGILGILLFEYFPELWDRPIWFVILLSIGYLILWFFEFVIKWKRVNFLLGVCGLTLITWIFGYISSSNNELNAPAHWRNVEGRIEAFEGRVVSDVLVKEKTYRYTVEVSHVLIEENTVQVSGQLHLYVQRADSVGLGIKYGHVLRVKATPSQIAPPTNPEEFNYSAYIAKQHIHGQCFVSPEFVNVVSLNPKSVVLEKAYELRAHFRSQIIKYIDDPDAQAIALALLIGVKDFLSEELTTAYASAGAMHVLAVSGLHVGILYMLLLFLMKPMEKMKGGKVLIAIISISIIWAYTFVTGMSPSVLRAATMFSVFAVSKAVLRDNNIYNSLGISAFVLLLYDPNLLFAVGFQLSFLAVTGIVYLQPRIYRMLYVRNRFLDIVWGITAVSIAAQIATLPLTVYYFNQFPTYFFLSNLVVIPGAMMIMVGGIVMLVIGSITDGLGHLIGWLLDWVIQLMNYLVQWVEQIPGSLITWLYLDIIQVWMVYVAMVLILLGLAHKSSFYLNASLLSICFVFGLQYSKAMDQLRRKELIVYDIGGTTAIDQIDGNTAMLHVNNLPNVDREMLRFQIDPFRRANGLNSFSEGLSQLADVTTSGGNIKCGSLLGLRVLVLDSLLNGRNITTPLMTDVLVINNESVKSVAWLKENFTFSHLIIGSDNSWRYSSWIQTELTKNGIASHSLLRQGSWRMAP